MHAALQQSGGLWFGWSGQESVREDVGDAWVREQEGITYATMDLNEVDYHGYYEGYANRICSGRCFITGWTWPSLDRDPIRNIPERERAVCSATGAHPSPEAR